MLCYNIKVIFLKVFITGYVNINLFYKLVFRAGTNDFRSGG